MVKIGRKRASLFSATIFLWAATIVTYFFAYPNFTSATVSTKDTSPRVVKWPFTVHDLPVTERKCEIPVDLGVLHPSQFSLFTDSDVTRVFINGIEVSRPFPWRNLDDQPIKLDFRHHAHLGNNLITIYLSNTTDTLYVKLFAFPKDAVVLTAIAVNLLALAATILLAQTYFPKTLTSVFAATLFLGIAIRILYVAGTPYHFRSHDLSGHVEYIRYVASHLSLPAEHYGWETHQSPLYYVICGFWMHLTGQEGSSWLYGQWQSFSLLLSIGSLMICVPIANLAFQNSNQASERSLFLLVLGVFPGLVYLAGQISNDSLFTLISFSWLYFLLRWWLNPSLRNAVLLAFILGIGILTKNTTFVLGGITLVCCVIQSKLTLQYRVKHISVIGAVCLLLAGWYQIPRVFSASTMPLFMVGNYTGIDRAAAISPSLLHSICFDPISMIKIPFNSITSDEYRRQYLLEFFYKSSLFGEWAWGPYLRLTSQILIASSLACIPIIFVGLYRGLVSPLWPALYLTAFLLLATVIIFVWLVPFSCSQDFRFVPLIIIPIAYFAAIGTERLVIAKWLIIFFAVNCILYLKLLTWA